MNREEKRRKFNEAVINMLYPPPQEENNDNKLPTNPLWEDFNPDIIPVPEKVDETSSSSSDDGDGETQKLTRAQRKRLRKKKLKEAMPHRRKIIGPVLPGGEDDVCKNVRCNVAEELDIAVGKQGGEESVVANNKKKMKQRRNAKRLAKEEAKSTSMEKPNQGCGSSSNDVK